MRLGAAGWRGAGGPGVPRWDAGPGSSAAAAARGAAGQLAGGGGLLPDAADGVPLCHVAGLVRPLRRSVPGVAGRIRVCRCPPRDIATCAAPPPRPVPGEVGRQKGPLLGEGGKGLSLAQPSVFRTKELRNAAADVFPQF